MSMAGMLLSQPARPTKPSNRSACMTHSTESVMTSRETSEARMPSWPMEMPSDTVMVPNSIGNPPASRTPSLLRSASLRSVRLQGVTSFQAEATPIWGLSQSLSVMPTARNMAREADFSMPVVTSWDRSFNERSGMSGTLPRRCDRVVGLYGGAVVAAILSADGLVKRFGAITALGGVTVDVSEGITGLLGANGAGKTTLLGLALGLTHPDGGRLEVLGLDPVTAGPDVRAIVGYSPEHQSLPPDVQAYDLVAHLAEIHGLPHRAATTRASDALYQVGLGEERFRPVGTMSTGQKQRVKLAAALAHDPALVLLDEPTDGLDPVQREDMLALIRRVGTEFGINVLLSSHLLDEVERVCDNAVILADGRVAAAGPLDELRTGVGGWYVEVEAGTDQLAAALRRAGATVAPDGRRLLVEDIESAAAVRDAVAALGLGLVRLERRRLTLEDVFLEAGVYG